MRPSPNLAFPKRRPARRRIVVLALITLALAGIYPGAAVTTAQQGEDGTLSPTARSQIAALMAEKEARTPAERKVNSNLLYAARQHGGIRINALIAGLRTGVEVAADATTEVDITAHVSDALLARLRTVGARAISAYPAYRSVRAAVPIGQVVAIAGWSDVIFVQPKQDAMIADAGAPAARPGASAEAADLLAAVTPALLPTLRPDFAERAARVRSRLSAALAPSATQGLTTTIATNHSEGDVAHRADLARQTYGYVGSGVKVCVLSDGVNSLAAVQAAGDLPDVTVLPGQAGSGNEGVAMLEIVHDLAPGARLFYATAFTSIASFADNIKTLRNTYGCDVLVDDVSYPTIESPFQLGQAPNVVSNTNGGIVAQAVNDVTASGALYFSSAGNSGNLNDGTSGVWEGDFADGGSSNLSSGGNLLDFDPGPGVQPYNVITSGSTYQVTLFWSDPLGGSGNDYDLFLIDSNGINVVGLSNNMQTGTQDPREFIRGPTSYGQRVVVVQRTGAQNRYVQINTNRGKLQFSTAGQTGGHAAALQGFGVAATGTQRPALAFNSAATVENFSSDGPRRYFFTPSGAAITPGNLSSTGGAVAQKPDLTAADGVSCLAPGFKPFLGTSAAAPHAAAIAALLRSAKPGITPAQIRALLTTAPGAIDIEAPGVDRDTGAGVIDALAAMQALAPAPVPLLSMGDVTFREGALSDGNGMIDPGESVDVAVPLTNTTLATATDVRVAVESLNDPALATMLYGGPIGYGALASGAGGGGASKSFAALLAPGVPCGTTLTFKITATFGGGGANSPQVFFARTTVGALTIATTLDGTAPQPRAAQPAYTTATGTQTGRLSRSGVASDCASGSSFPGVNSGTGERRYDAFTFTNPSASPACVTVRLTMPGYVGANGLFAVAYGGGGYTPANPSANYLADPGDNADPQNPQTFSFLVPAGEQFTIVVHEIDPGTAIGPELGAYTLAVEGPGVYLCAAPPRQPVVYIPRISR